MSASEQDWETDRAIRAAVADARTSGSGDAEDGEVRATVNLHVSVISATRAEAVGYEIGFVQRGSSVIANGVFRRVDTLRRRDGRWAVVESASEPILGGGISPTRQRPDAAAGMRMQRSDWRDHRDIERLGVAYARYIDEGDFEALATLLARATWNGLSGSAEVREWMRENIPLREDGRPGTLHAISNVVIDVDGDTALGSSTLAIYRAAGDRVEPYIVNDYHDRYARDADGWYFVQREIVRRLRAE